MADGVATQAQGQRFSLGKAMELALNYHKAGELERAADIYRRVLKQLPNHADSLHLLGVVNHQLGRHEDAVTLMRRAVASGAANAACHNNLGEALRALGRLDEAIDQYRAAVLIDPQAYEAHNNLGVALMRSNRLAEAEESLRASIAVKPDYAEAYMNLGSLEQRRRNFARSHEYLDRALAIRPDYADALFNKVVALRDERRMAEAAETCRVLVDAHPGHRQGLNELGNLLRAGGDIKEAVTWYRRAVAADGNYPDALNNLGTLLHRLGKQSEAEGYLRRAVKVKPDFADAWFHLGNVIRDAHRKNDEALACYRRAVEATPTFFNAWNNMGLTLRYQGKLPEAMRCFSQAMKLQPNDGMRLKASVGLPVIHSSHESMLESRAGLEKRLDALLARDLDIGDPLSMVGSLLFHLAYMGMDDRPLMEKLAAVYRKACPSLTEAAPHALRPPAPADGRRIRVGMVSRFFRQHTIGLLFKGLVSKLPRDRYEVTVMTYDAALDRDWQVISRAANRSLLLPNNLAEARKKIGELELDVLLYPDIGMDPASYYLTFARLAPVQSVCWGHPVTTGVEAMDWFVSAEDLEIAGADAHYSERLWRLGFPPTYYYRPEAKEVATRADFSLPEDRNLYLCPQSAFKFHPDFDRIVAGILRTDPKGEVILVSVGDSHWITLLRQRLQRTMPDVLKRVRVLERMPRGRFIGLMSVCDVMLDTLHFSGGNTSFEGLSRGTPIVTMPSDFMRGRVTYALYRQMGMDDCIARSEDEYVRIATEIGSDLDRRAATSVKIRERHDVLYENPRAVEEWDKFFTMAVDEASGGVAAAIGGQ